MVAACNSKPAGTTNGDAPRPADASQQDAIASADAPAGLCDPVGQTGCGANEKCTWIRTSTAPTGELACAPDGAVAANGACAWGTVGPTTGYDNCARGLVCFASSTSDAATGTCQAICDSTTNACGPSYACARYTSFFASPIGICMPTCDPLAQTRDFDGAFHCGGPLGGNNQPTVACTGLASTDARASTFTCAPVLDATKGGDTFAAGANGEVYANSCAAGYAPLLFNNTADAVAGDPTKIICVAYCTPAPTSTTSTTMAGGTAPHTCAAAGTGGTHECRYWWSLEAATTTSSQRSNGLGFCYDYTNYTYDGTALHPPTSPTTPEPSCKVLSATATTLDDPTMGGAQVVPDNFELGCTQTDGSAYRPTLFYTAKTAVSSRFY